MKTNHLWISASYATEIYREPQSCTEEKVKKIQLAVKAERMFLVFGGIQKLILSEPPQNLCATPRNSYKAVSHRE